MDTNMRPNVSYFGADGYFIGYVRMTRMEICCWKRRGQVSQHVLPDEATRATYENTTLLHLSLCPCACSMSGDVCIHHLSDQVLKGGLWVPAQPLPRLARIALQ